MSYTADEGPSAADLIAAVVGQLGGEGEIVGVNHRLGALDAWAGGERTALAAFRWLAATCLDGAQISDDVERRERRRKIGGSLELIASLQLPGEFTAQHVVTGLRLQRNDRCDELAAILEEQGVEPLPFVPFHRRETADLWWAIAGAARAQAHAAQGDKGLRARWSQIVHTYERGGRALVRGLSPGMGEQTRGAP